MLFSDAEPRAGGDQLSELPYDPVNPPRDPPAAVVRPMLWRVAVRLHTDHGDPRAGAAVPSGRAVAAGEAAAGEVPATEEAGATQEVAAGEVEGGERCRLCGDPWPCFPRRLAERGLAAAFWR